MRRTGFHPPRILPSSDLALPVRIRTDEALRFSGCFRFARGGFWQSFLPQNARVFQSMENGSRYTRSAFAPPATRIPLVTEIRSDQGGAWICVVQGIWSRRRLLGRRPHNLCSRHAPSSVPAYVDFPARHQPAIPAVERDPTDADLPVQERAVLPAMPPDAGIGGMPPAELREMA